MGELSIGRFHIRIWQIICLLFVLALGLRSYGLADIDEFIFDEVHYVPSAEIMVGIKEHPGMGLWADDPLIGKSPAPNFEHPLLGKFAIGLGMLIFGNNQLGWRFFSVVFGSISLLLFFVTALVILKDSRYALLAFALLSFDSMHIVQSRIAMLDIFMHFALVALLLCCYKLVEQPKSMGWAVISGIVIAFGLSIKWAFSFAVLGFTLSVLICGQSQIMKRILAIALSAVISFGLYNLWFLYYLPLDFTYQQWIEYHLASIRATTGIISSHPYGATATSMLFNERMVWYYFRQSADFITTGIICLINPLIVYLTIPAVLYVGINYFKSRKLIDAFIPIWFLCCYLPFHIVLAKRQGFLYYMLLLLPIIILAIVRSMAILSQYSWSRMVAVVYLVVFVSAFVFLMPVTLGIPFGHFWYELISSYTRV